MGTCITTHWNRFAEEIEDVLGHMTDKPLKNGRKYVDSGFVHDIMDTVNGERYFVRAHVWPSMRTELPHHVIVVISVNSGAVLHASCEPCRASSLGRCSHVVAVLFSVLDYVQKHGPVLAKPCTSEECSWNKGKKRNKNPGRISEEKCSSKKKLQSRPQTLKQFVQVSSPFPFSMLFLTPKCFTFVNIEWASHCLEWREIFCACLVGVKSDLENLRVNCKVIVCDRVEFMAR